MRDPRREWAYQRSRAACTPLRKKKRSCSTDFKLAPSPSASRPPFFTAGSGAALVVVRARKLRSICTGQGSRMRRAAVSLLLSLTRPDPLAVSRPELQLSLRKTIQTDIARRNSSGRTTSVDGHFASTLSQQTDKDSMQRARSRGSFVRDFAIA